MIIIILIWDNDYNPLASTRAGSLPRALGPWCDRDPQSGPGQMHVLDYDTPEGPKRLRSASIQKRGREVVFVPLSREQKPCVNMCEI